MLKLIKIHLIIYIKNYYYNYLREKSFFILNSRRFLNINSNNSLNKFYFYLEILITKNYKCIKIIIQYSFSV